MVAIWFEFQTPKAAAPEQATLTEKVLQMDIPGVILICTAIVCFTLATQWAGVEKDWSDSTVVGLLVGTVLLVIIFAADQWYQGERATLMLSFLRNRKLLVGAVFEFL